MPQTLLNSKTGPTKEGGVLKLVVGLKLDRFHQTCFIIGFGSGQNGSSSQTGVILCYSHVN
ncbi:hypothetical protein HanHA300_Chr05g0167641 [Helianthus annuus]|nr:hypothetical protein HanHA300_Chr05g0167641 [Helianthus annuus]KAJ0583876.1 hypothetical protein HanHA89_Chr05g0181721 [Helianthus annuus]